MKKFLTMAVALGALVAAPAMAADMRPPPPVYRAPPPVVPIWTWTGCYIGGHVGGLWARKQIVDNTLDDPFFGEINHNVNGWLAGVQAGCDYQFAGGWVIGIQSDYAWTGAKGSHVSLLNPDLTIETKIKWVGSATARLGYAWGGFLGYVKGGGAWEQDNFDVFDNITLESFGTLGGGALAGPSASVANMPSPTGCPASSSTITTTSVAATLLSAMPLSSTSKKPRAS